jgi:hypothetical protein
MPARRGAEESWGVRPVCAGAKTLPLLDAHYRTGAIAGVAGQVNRNMAETARADRNGKGPVGAFHLTGATKAGSLLALLLCATVTHAQTTAARAAAASVPSKGITYVDGQLRINVLDQTLAEVLAKVSSITGVSIEIPPGASSERMPVVDFGPGPARHVIASLLGDSNFDYLIQASASDPDKVQSVMVISRDKDKKGGAAVLAKASAPASKQDDAPAVVAFETPATTVADAGAQAPPTAPEPTAPRIPPMQSDIANALKGGSPPPPASLDAQSINSQLQQMYQQRMQMVQQERGIPAK